MGAQLVGLGAGEALWRITHGSAGDFSLALSGGLWSGLFTFFVFAANDLDKIDTQVMFGTMLAISDAGLIGAALLASQVPFSRGRVLVIDGVTLEDEVLVGPQAVFANVVNTRAANTGAPATFTDGQTILTDNLPNAGLTYGAVSVQNVSNISGVPFINCAITSSNLTCTASGGSVTFALSSACRSNMCEISTSSTCSE